MEAKIKHLEFIQAAINRMAGNSFLLKGWSVTLTSALLAVSVIRVILPPVIIPIVNEKVVLPVESKGQPPVEEPVSPAAGG